MQRRRLALLALLAAARRGISRDKLVAYLWPDSDPDRARRLLSDSAYRINQAVGGEAIVAVGDELRLDTRRLTCDVCEFAQAIDAGDWRGAVELYAGPFMDGFVLTGAVEFEHWVDAERERLRHERARALEALAAAADDPATAVRWWRTLAADDPYSSRIALHLMRALEAAGDRAAAVQHARVHTTLVTEELGVEPDAGVATYADRLRAAPAPTPAMPTLRPPSPPSAPPPLSTASGLPERNRANRRWPVLLAAAAALVALVVWVVRAQDGARGIAPDGEPPAAMVVLPFADISPDGDQAYLADGITEELIVRLSQVPGLRVVGRSSAYALARERVGTREIAERFSVSAVLEGSVRRAGDRLRISVQLVDAHNGFQLWSDVYERELQDVFAIQDEIAHAVVTRLTGSFATEVQLSRATSPLDDPEAYNLYLRGRFEWHKRTEQGLRNAAEYFRQAVSRDPDHARAWAGLGDALAVLGFYDYLPPAEAFPPARQAAAQALRINPSLAQPHATLGYVSLYHDWDWPQSEAEFLHAIELDPSYSTGHQWYANFLTAMGRFDEAAREMRAAQDLDPLSLIANAALGWVLYYAGENERAIDQLERTLELNAEFELAYLWRGLALEQMGRFDEARHSIQHAVELSGGSAISLALLARTSALAGDEAAARALLAELERRADARYVPAFEVAKIHDALGDPQRALLWLARAREQRSHSMAFLAVDPQLAGLRAEPGFVDLVRDVGLDRRPMRPPRR